MNRRRALMAVGGGSPTVHGTWADLFRTIDAGTYATEYAVGEILPLDLGSQGVVNAQIVAFNADNKSDNSGKAPVTFITQYLLATSKLFNTYRNPQKYSGWADSDIRVYILGTIAPLFPSEVSNRILSVSKKTQEYQSGQSASSLVTSTETIWMPSRRELFKSGESSGIDYTAFFSENSKRIKAKTSGGSATQYITRSISRVLNNGASLNIAGINTGGSINYYDDENQSRGICIGFCIG